MELRFLRDEKAREVDFVVIENKRPLFAVEAKLSDINLSSHISYFEERTPIPQFYQVSMSDKDYSPYKKIRVLPFWKFEKEVLSNVNLF